MVIKYKPAPEIESKAREISNLLFPHVRLDSISCIRSFGSSSRRTIARCHALGKVMQLGMKTKAFYTLEFLSERFDKLSEEDQLKVIIHELMHIPKTFGGGFKHHDFVCEKNVNLMYTKFKEIKNENKKWF
jgi:predicted metallopeptidase